MFELWWIAAAHAGPGMTLKRVCKGWSPNGSARPKPPSAPGVQGALPPGAAIACGRGPKKGLCPPSRHLKLQFPIWPRWRLSWRNGAPGQRIWPFSHRPHQALGPRRRPCLVSLARCQTVASRPMGRRLPSCRCIRVWRKCCCKRDPAPRRWPHFYRIETFSRPKIAISHLPLQR